MRQANPAAGGQGLCPPGRRAQADQPAEVTAGRNQLHKRNAQASFVVDLAAEPYKIHDEIRKQMVRIQATYDNPAEYQPRLDSAIQGLADEIEKILHPPSDTNVLAFAR
jgi:hypothetical protein